MGSFAGPPPMVARVLGSEHLLLLLMFIFLISQSTILFILGPIAHDLLSLQVFALFDPNIFRTTFGKFSTEDKIRFEKHFMVDFWFHPSLYALMFVVWVTLETRKANKSPIPYFLFISIPIAAGLCDIAENTIHLQLAKTFPAGSDNMIRLGAFFATVKWILVIPVGIWCLRSYLLRRGDKAKAQ